MKSYYIKHDPLPRTMTEAEAKKYKKDNGDTIWEMKKAVIIIDMWDSYPKGNNRYDNLVEQIMLKLFKFILNDTGIPVILACHETYRKDGIWLDTGQAWTSPNNTIWEATERYEHGLVSWNEKEIIEFLKLHEVTDLYYAGVSYPGCIEGRPVGINNMSDKFFCHVIADCVLNMCGTGYTESEILEETYYYLLNNKRKDKISFIRNIGYKYE
tara:strand:+ start:121 stop:756 length:636 start_codon:yes stop_codon:yes gene_type:complete